MIPVCETAWEKRTAFLKLTDITQVHDPGFHLIEVGGGILLEERKN